MKRALLLIRKLPHYRREGFEQGLKRSGYQIVDKYDQRNLCDLLIVWNRHALNEAVARVYQKQGIPVIVAENGYIGEDKHGHHLFAFALDHHNGAGRFPVGDFSRWQNLNIDVKPWRTERGRDLLILPQRGVGPAGVAMPRNWPLEFERRMKRTNRFVRVRPHPGNSRGQKKKPITEDLNGVFMACVWASSAGIKCIVEGVPVYHEFPDWIAKDGATRSINNPFIGDRTEMFTRIAWGQCEIDEIATGEPFDRLLLHGGYKSCV